ncbi:MAG: hypothetical protein JF584_13990 [Acidobacteria bacterium]|nr:hypothetical protein [Acidobacteriota bacterium]
MKSGAEDKKKVAIAGTLGAVAVICLGYIIWDNFLSSPATTATPPAAPVIRDLTPNGGTAANTGRKGGGATGGTTAKKVGTTAAQLDPTLHMEAMKVVESLEYSGSGRNIFSMTSAPPPMANIPKPIAPPRPITQPVNLAPVGPPPPPPINLRFFGVATRSNGQRQAFLLQGDDVFLAGSGDVVARRYKVVTVNATSAVVMDMTNNNQQTLPLVTQ